MESKATEARPVGDLVWYFAYGSNMSSQKFSKDRGIKPLKEARMRLPGWKLAFNIPGLPYSEPSFASIVPHTSDSAAGARSPEVLGVAYLITHDQYVEVLASEGGGIAYEDIQVEAVPVSHRDAELTGPQVKVRTLGAAIERKPWPCPSKRYMDILLVGSVEAHLPKRYHEYLQSIVVFEPPVSRRGKAGAAIFLALWAPLFRAMEMITNATMNDEGNVPGAVRWMVRTVVFVMWFAHDTFFAPVFGGGDGNKQGHQKILDPEQAPLLGVMREDKCITTGFN